MKEKAKNVMYWILAIGIFAVAIIGGGLIDHIG